jgi:rhodanese-related sulfurtransferase
MRTIDVTEVQSGTLTLIDVREYPEFAAGAIRGSQLVPLSLVTDRSSAWDKGEALVMVCKSGRRATQAAERLEAMGFSNISVLEGGVDAWKLQGFPLQIAAHRPWALERQVRVVAGSLVLVFSALGFTVSPKLFLGSALIGAGLVFAGVSNTCMMGSLLSRMPWNRAELQSTR